MLDALRKAHADREARTGHHSRLFGVGLWHMQQATARRVLNIGPGQARFEKLAMRSYCVDFVEGNRTFANELREYIAANGLHQWRVYLQDARESLPQGQYDAVWCSHMIEHLTGQELYAFLHRVDQALRPGGLFVVAAPFLWGHFYADPTHVRPYTMHVFNRALCSPMGDMTWPPVATGYKVLAYVEGLEEHDHDEAHYAGRTFAADLVVRALRWCVAKVGIRAVKANSWLMVMQKGAE